MFVMIRRALVKAEAVPAIEKGYQSNVAGPVLDSPGSRFCAVLLNADNPLEVRQMTGWDSREACDRYLKEVYPAVWEEWNWVFDEPPAPSFWQINWPGKLMFNPLQAAGPNVYVRTSRFKLKPEGVAHVRNNFDEEVIDPVVRQPGNRFIFVLHSAEEERVGSQVTGWDSKEDCDNYLNNVFPEVFGKVKHVFEEPPIATFWNIKWPVIANF